jgi:hypothetical protein
LEYKVKFKPRYGSGLPAHQLLYELINSNRAYYSELLYEALKYIDVFQNIKKMVDENDKINPVYNNGFLPGLDIIGIYTIISKYKPETYIEVGSGNSTKVAGKAIKDNNLSTKIISIDPMPRTEIDLIADQIIR